jgi:PKD repeat protein
VTFSRTGTNADVYSAQWFFGDGNSLSDTSMTASHTYAAPGLYTVSLSVQSSCGYTSYSSSLRVYGGPASLSGLTIGTSGAQITYSVTATDADSVRWFFDFPNATPSASGLSGTHTYAANGTYTVAAIAYNPCGNDTVSQTVSITTASLPAGALAGAWSLYPNPTHSTFTVAHPTYAGSAEVRLIDLHGRLVEHRTVTHLPAQLSIALPAGLYTVQVLTPQETATLRLLVE